MCNESHVEFKQCADHCCHNLTIAKYGLTGPIALSLSVGLSAYLSLSLSLPLFPRGLMPTVISSMMVSVYCRTYSMHTRCRGLELCECQSTAVIQLRRFSFDGGTKQSFKFSLSMRKCWSAVVVFSLRNTRLLRPLCHLLSISLTKSSHLV